MFVSSVLIDLLRLRRSVMLGWRTKVKTDTTEKKQHGMTRLMT